MKQRLFRPALILILIGICVGFACKKDKVEIDSNVASSDEALYKLGEKYLEKDIEKARIYFRQVIDSFPKSYYAQKAKLAIADSYFEKGDEGSMIIAASEYREFIQIYPFSPSAAYAQYKIAMTYFKKILKPGRDQTKTRQALSEFKKVITAYPLSEEAKKAQENIEKCEEYLAEHILHIGELYYKRNSFKASISRLLDILTTYPNFSKMDQVYYYIGNSYFEWKKYDQSLPYLTKLVTDFPESKYADKASDKIDEIEKKREKK